MSIRWHFMSSRPSSNTANRPHGPAPMMSTSVLIGSFTARINLATSILAAGAARSNCRRLSSRCDRTGKGAVCALSRGLAGALDAVDPHEEIAAPRARIEARGSGLTFLHRHHQPVERVGHLDLAGELLARPHVK